MLSTWVCGSPRRALKHWAVQRHRRKHSQIKILSCSPTLMTSIFWIKKQTHTHTLNLASQQWVTVATQGWMRRTCRRLGSDARNGGHDGAESSQNISDGPAIRTLLGSLEAWWRKNDTIWTINYFVSFLYFFDFSLQAEDGETNIFSQYLVNTEKQKKFSLVCFFFGSIK